MNENYHRINAANQEKEPDSLLNFYRKAIILWKSLRVVREGTYKEHFHSNSRLYVYSRETERQKLLVICSFARVDTRIKIPRNFDLQPGRLILQSHNEISDSILKPYESRVYFWD